MSIEPRLAVLLLVALHATAAPVASWLRPGETATGTTVAGKGCYSARLFSSVYVRFRQFDPAGDAFLEIRLPGFPPLASGELSVSFVVSVPGVYSVCMVRFSGSGREVRFRLHFEPPRPPGPEDEARLHAEHLGAEAGQLTRRGGLPELRLALTKYAEALPIWEKLRDFQMVTFVLTAIGDAKTALGDNAGAIRDYYRALQVCPGDAPFARAEALTNSSVASLRLGDAESARTGFLQAVELWKRQPGREYERAAALSNLGIIYRRTSEVQLSIQAYLEALPALRRQNPVSAGVALSNIAVAYRTAGDLSRAEQYLRRSIPLVAPDKTALGKSLTNLGRVCSLRGEVAEAMRYFAQARILLRGSPSLAEVENNEGQLLLRKGQYSQALRHLLLALTLYADSSQSGSSSALHYAGIARSAMGDFSEAVESLTRSLQYRLASGDDEAPLTLLELARVQRKQNLHHEARLTLEQALSLIDQVRRRVSAPDLRASRFSAQRPVFSEFIDLLMQQASPGGDPSPISRAFEISEMARARSLSDSLGGARFAALHRVPAPLRERELHLVRNLAFQGDQLERLPDSPQTAGRRTALRNSIADLELQYESLEGEVSAADPLGSEVASLHPPDSAQISRLLDDSTVLVEFCLGQPRSYVWLVTSHGIQAFPLPGTAELERLAEPVISLAGDRLRRLRQPLSQHRYDAAARRLSDVLLGKLAPALIDRRVIVVADGVLNSIPWAVIPSPSAPHKPLGISNELVNLPSASIPVALRRTQLPHVSGPLRIRIVADPVLWGDGRLPPNIPQRPPGPPRLMFAAAEARSVAGAARGLSVALSTGFEATKAALFREPADIFHLAVHASIDGDHPETSRLYFSQADRRSRPVDGILGLYEIYNMQLPAELVVLSACRTSTGRIFHEGVTGMARAFFLSGAKRLIVSYWDAPDESTSVFFRRFYRELFSSPNVAPAAALRAAREYMWNHPEWHDPSYWGFALEGEWLPIRPAGATL